MAIAYTFNLYNSLQTYTGISVTTFLFYTILHNTKIHNVLNIIEKTFYRHTGVKSTKKLFQKLWLCMKNCNSSIKYFVHGGKIVWTISLKYLSKLKQTTPCKSIPVYSKLLKPSKALQIKPKSYSSEAIIHLCTVSILSSVQFHFNC